MNSLRLQKNWLIQSLKILAHFLINSVVYIFISWLRELRRQQVARSGRHNSSQFSLVILYSFWYIKAYNLWSCTPIRKMSQCTLADVMWLVYIINLCVYNIPLFFATSNSIFLHLFRKNRFLSKNEILGKLSLIFLLFWKYRPCFVATLEVMNKELVELENKYSRGRILISPGVGLIGVKERKYGDKF